MTSNVPKDLDEKDLGTTHHVEDQTDVPMKPSEVALDAAAKGQATTGYETMGVMDTIKTFKLATAICFLTCFSAATEGYQIGINASIVANKGFIRQFATKMKDGEPYLESPKLSGWGSIMSVGQILGQTTIPFIANRFGRKVAFYWLWTFLAASVLAESLARNWQVWLVAKFLAGIGCGCLQANIPPYVSEIAPVRIRGSLLMTYAFWWSTGSFFAQIALYRMNAQSPYNYLTPIYTQWAQIGIMAIIYLLIPESPVWAASKGNEQRAKDGLTLINRGVPDYNVDHQYSTLSLLLEHEKQVAQEQKRESWYSIFQGTDLRRTLIALTPGVSQQFIGLKLFSTYATYFFQQAGVANPFTVKCITSSIQIASVLGGVLIAEKVGRRIMICSSVTLAWACCIVVGILGLVPRTNPVTYVFILFACFWNVGMVTIGSASASYTGEISSQRLRSHTVGFATAITATVGIIMDVLVPYMVNAQEWNWGFKTGWFYGGVGLIAVVAVWLTMPETKGRSVGELDELFERKIKAWRFSKTETATQRLIKVEN